MTNEIYNKLFDEELSIRDYIEVYKCVSAISYDLEDCHSDVSNDYQHKLAITNEIIRTINDVPERKMDYYIQDSIREKSFEILEQYLEN